MDLTQCSITKIKNVVLPLKNLIFVKLYYCVYYLYFDTKYQSDEYTSDI